VTCLQKGRQRHRPGGVVDIQVGGTAYDNGLAGNGWRRAQRSLCIYLWDWAVTGDGPGTGVRQWGPCSGVGEAGWRSGQRHSKMTAAWSAGPQLLTSPTTVPGACLGPSLARNWLSSHGCYSGRAVVAPAEQTSTGCRHWWSDTVARPSSTLVSTVELCACIGPPPLQPPSTPFIEITSVHLCLLRTVETGWRGGRRRTYRPISRSQSRTSMKNACPWKLYTPPGMCDDAMYVCHSIRHRPR